MFTIPKDKQEDLNEFLKHECDLPEYSGAIGGGLTYQFTPTSFVCVIIVKCGCGEEIDLSGYESW